MHTQTTNNKQQFISQHVFTLAIYAGDGYITSKGGFALYQQVTTVYTHSPEINMQSSISLPATPKQPPVMISHILRSGAISQDRPIITDTPPMTTIATGYTVPPTLQDPKEALLAVIVDHLRRRPLTHVQKLALGIIADFTLAVQSQEKAEVESLKAVTERIAEREAAAGEAVAEAELGGEEIIDTALLGTVNLAVDEPALLPAFQPQQTPKATSGEANKQQSTPARYPLRKLRLRMPMVHAEGTEEEEPATLEEVPVQQLHYVDMKRRLTAEDVKGADFGFLNKKNGNDRLHYKFTQTYAGKFGFLGTRFKARFSLNTWTSPVDYWLIGRKGVRFLDLHKTISKSISNSTTRRTAKSQRP